MSVGDTAAVGNAGVSWSRRILVAILAVLLISVIVALGAGFRRDPKDIKSGGVGKTAPAFALERLDGTGMLRLDEYRGKTVILNFWASWCIPCKQENPALAAVWERYRASTDVILIGILYQDSVEAAREYTARYGNTWPSVVDADGRTAIAYGVFGIPETFFITPDGIVAGRHVGAIDQQTLTNGIESIRRRPASSVERPASALR